MRKTVRTLQRNWSAWKNWAWKHERKQCKPRKPRKRKEKIPQKDLKIRRKKTTDICRKKFYNQRNKIKKKNTEQTKKINFIQ